MQLELWWPWYRRIVSDFGYSVDADREAATVLRELISNVASPLADLRSLIQSQSVVVFGAGPSLAANLSQFISSSLRERAVVIVADGATTALLERKIGPHVVVTDLDGIVEDITEAGKLGASIVIHGHGDNIAAMKNWIPKIIENSKAHVYGTTQVEPLPPKVNNFGGFTDGDRAVFLANELGARSITLAGMDLGMAIGKYSKDRASDTRSATQQSKWLSEKRLKLKYAKLLLEWLAVWSEARGRLFNATGPRGETIKGFKPIRFSKTK